MGAAKSSRELPPDPVAPLDFEAVYEAEFAFVWRSLRRLGVPEAALDDAVQEVFLVVHRRLGEFEQRASIKTWLFGIALHVAQHQRRSLARRLHGEVATLSADPATPQDEASMREDIRLLYGVLDELDTDKRAVFVMCHLEQMTAPEIAEAARIPLNTVYSRLRAARQRFEAALSRLRARAERRKP